MQISYWQCPHHDCDEATDGEDWWWVYGCTHPDNTDGCYELDNKYCDKTADCPLLDREEPDANPTP